MPKLDQRLACVARMIGTPGSRDGIHADIGSDHGHLLLALLKSGRIRRGIAIENKKQPFENSNATLRDAAAEVRFADGFAGLGDGEADSVSLCGMGGQLIAGLLQRHPERVPDRVFVQANAKMTDVRRWAIPAGYHLIDEQEVLGSRTFLVMEFRAGNGQADPAYEHDFIRSLDDEAALVFGPHLLRRWEPDFVQRMIGERDYWRRIENAAPPARERLRLIQQVLDARSVD